MRTSNGVVLAVTATLLSGFAAELRAQSPCGSNADTLNVFLTAVKHVYSVSDSARLVTRGFLYARPDQIVAVTAPEACSTALAAYNQTKQLSGLDARTSVYVVALGSAGYLVFDPSYSGVKYEMGPAWQVRRAIL